MTARSAIWPLVLAQTFSISGTRLSTIAVPWLVLTLSGDPVLTGIVAFAEMAPYVLAKAFGGPLLDRFGPRTVSMLGDAASLVVVATIPLLSAFGALDPLALVPLVAVLGVLRGPADAAKQAMIPAVVREAGIPLERMTGIMGAIERLASTIGAALAGLLVAAIGPAPALAVNAGAFGLAALVALFAIPAQPRPSPTATDTPTSGYWRQLGEGVVFLRNDAVLVGIVVMVALTNLFDQAFAVVLVPVWADATGGGPAVLGLVFAVFSGFSVLGAIVATALAERLPRLPVYTIAFMLVGLPRFAVFALGAPFPAILAVLALGGFASGFLNPILSAVTLERIPPGLVGRVSSLVTAASWALMPFGGIVAGVLVAGLGLPAAMLIAGLCYFAITTAPLAFRSFRAFSERPAPIRSP